jgi:cation transport ATPase
MKNLFFLFITLLVFSQSEKLVFPVNGNCKMCKSRIEKAALMTRGVKYANWRAETQQLTLILNSNKTTLDSVAKNVAAVGHDAGNFQALEKVYQDLPMCCLYRDSMPH